MGFLPNAQLNAAIEALFPSSGVTHTASATNGTTTLTFTQSESLMITPGMTVAGAGISGSTPGTANVVYVSSVNNSTGVVTVATHGTASISTLTASSYTFSQAQWGSLHTATPGTTGASECTDTNYARQSISWTAPASGGFATAGVKANSASVTWPAGAGATGFAASQTIGWFGFWTYGVTVTSSAPAYWLGGGSMTSITLPIGSQLYAAVGAITLTESG